MDPILQTLFSWQFILFGMAIAAVVYVIRTVVEYFLPAKDAKPWNDLILPIMPVIMGGVAGLLFKYFPYPDGLTNAPDRLVFGLVAGLLSTLMYRVFKAILFQKIQGVSPSATSTILTNDQTTNNNLPPRGVL